MTGHICRQAIKGENVAAVLGHLKKTGGFPKRIKVDNGPEFISRALDAWVYFNHVKLDYFPPAVSRILCKL